MEKSNQLRDKHKTFTYQEYSWELVNNDSNNSTNKDLKLKFTYKISPDITFTPTTTIHNVTQEMIDKLGKDKLNNYVFNVGLSEMYSYWKTTASQDIVIKTGLLSQEQINFWKKLLLKGMGEFFYQNKIEFNKPDFVKFTSSLNNSNKDQSPLPHNHLKNSINTHQLTNKTNSTQNFELKQNTQNTKTLNKPKVLIPVGGGKDSSVSLELLKNNFEVGTYTVSAPESAQEIIAVTNIPKENQINISRTLDPKLFELNKNGYLNGHVPISAYLAFLSLLTADLFGYTHITISNERSSNEGNVWYCDQEINHQYSKSYEFESDLQNYVTQYISIDAPLYFSFLRPLYELQIAQIFSGFTDYHPVFKSCNRGSKHNSWCGECSKCLFAWTIMFPFLGSEKLKKYFGKNLFEDENLWQITLELLGLSNTKPFDCVGTHEETISAFFLSIQSLKNGAVFTSSDSINKNLPNSDIQADSKLKTNTNSNSNEKLPIILEKVEAELKTNTKLQNNVDGESDYQKRANTILNAWNTQNSLPKEFSKLLKTKL